MDYGKNHSKLERKMSEGQSTNLFHDCAAIRKIPDFFPVTVVSTRCAFSPKPWSIIELTNLRQAAHCTLTICSSKASNPLVLSLHLLYPPLIPGRMTGNLIM